MVRGPHASLGFDLADGSDHWIQARQYDAENRLVEQALPSAVIGYNEASAELGISLRTSEGPFTKHLTEYYSSTGGGGVAGYRHRDRIKQGSGGTPVTPRELQYATRSAGRLTSRDYRTRANSPSGTISDSDTFTYDDASRMLTAVSGRYSNTVTHTYDAAGRKSSESLTISGQTYTCDTEYDAAGRVSKLTYPDGTEVERDYTDRGQLHTVKVDTTTVDTRGYDDGGRMTSSGYDNGVSESRSYNDDDTLASIAYSGAAIGNLSYGWDVNRNKTSETIGGVMSGYGFTASYDDEDRLTGWDRADTNLDQSWDLSAVGNWDKFIENTTTQNRTHSAANEILTVDSDNVDHDPKGNTTFLPSSLRPTASRLTWDFDNKLRSADIDDSGTDDVFYRWDALGRRVGRDDGTDDVVYFQVGQQTFADYPAGTAASSPTYNYVYGSYIDEIILRTGSGGNRYYHRNQQYSVTALTDGSGTVVERYAYAAYGQPVFLDGSGTALTASAESNRMTYTGREWDSGVSLYHYRARMYDAVAGRFLGRDPIGFEGSPWNLYEYVEGRPITERDPTGLAGTCRENFRICVEAAGDEAAKCREFESDFDCMKKMFARQAICAAKRAKCIMKKIRPRFRLPVCPVILGFPPDWLEPGPGGHHMA